MRGVAVTYLRPTGVGFNTPVPETGGSTAHTASPEVGRDRVLGLVGMTELTRRMFAEDNAVARFLALLGVFVVNPGDTHAASHFFHAFYCTLLSGEDGVDPVERKRYLNLLGADNLTPLARAIIRNKDDVLPALLAWGAEVMRPIPFSEAHIDRNRNGVTLCIARQKSVELLERLLEAAKAQNASFMTIEDGFGLTPLWTAICCDNPKSLPLLVQHGASLEERNQAGSTPLTEATSVEMCRALLECGAEIDAADKNGRTALHSAIYRRDVDLIRLLLDRNAMIDAHTIKNLANDPELLEVVLEKPRRLPSAPLLAMLLKVERIPPRELIDFLSKSGADMNAHDKKGYTALHIAVRRGDQALVEQLLECGADINCKSFVNAFGHGGFAALHLAVLKGNGALVNLLLERGADINCKTTDGRTALSIAGQSDDREMIGALLDRGADYWTLSLEQREAVFRHDEDHPPS